MCVFVMLETEVFLFFKFSYSNMAVRVSGHMKLVKRGYLVNQGFTKPAAT